MSLLAIAQNGRIDGSFEPTRDSSLGGSQILGAPRDQILCANITSLGEPRLAVVSRAVTKYWNRSHARDDAKNDVPAAQRSFTQPPRAFTTQRRDATRRAGRAAEAAGR